MTGFSLVASTSPFLAERNFSMGSFLVVPASSEYSQIVKTSPVTPRYLTSQPRPYPPGSSSRQTSPPVPSSPSRWALSPSPPGIATTTPSAQETTRPRPAELPPSPALSRGRAIRSLRVPVSSRVKTVPARSIQMILGAEGSTSQLHCESASRLHTTSPVAADTPASLLPFASSLGSSQLLLLTTQTTQTSPITKGPSSRGPPRKVFPSCCGVFDQS